MGGAGWLECVLECGWLICACVRVRRAGRPGGSRVARASAHPPTHLPRHPNPPSAPRSGGSHGFVIGHVCPEAQEGGPIALVRDGDVIRIDAESRVMEIVGVDDAELQRRWGRARACMGGCGVVGGRTVCMFSLPRDELTAPPIPALTGSQARRLVAAPAQGHLWHAVQVH